MTANHLIKADANGQLRLQSIFIPPLRLKVSTKIGYLRKTLQTGSNGRRHWGRNVTGLFSGLLSQ